MRPFSFWLACFLQHLHALKPRRPALAICGTYGLSTPAQSHPFAPPPSLTDPLGPYALELSALILACSLILFFLIILAQVRRRSQQALEESRHNYRDLFNASNEAIMIHDFNTGQIRDVNRRYTALYGWSREEAATVTIADASSNIAPYTLDHALERFRLVREVGPQLFEWQARKKDGSLFWAEVSLHTERFNGQPVVVSSVRDISERKRAQAHANALEHQLKQTFANLPIGLFALDRAHRITQWNPMLEKMTGVPARQMLGSTDSWRGFYRSARPTLADLLLDGLDIAQINAQHGAMVFPSRQIADAIEAEAYFPDMQQSGRWLHFTAIPLHDPDGSRVGILETISDITERKEAEIALFENEATYRTLIEHAPEAILVINAETSPGRFIEANSHAERLLGYPQDALLNMDASHISPLLQAEGERSLERMAHYREEALKGQDICFEWLCRHASGRLIPCEVHIVQLPSHQNRRLLRCSIFDISERKAAQAALINERNFLQVLLEAIPIPIFYKNRAGIYLGCNDAFLDMMHVTRAQVIGKTLYDWLPRPLAEQYEKKDEELYAAPDGRQVFQRLVNQHLHDPRHAIIHRALFRDQEGRIAGMIGALLDVSELQNMRLALEELNHALEARVIERTDELQKAMKHLVQSEKLAALGSLVAGIAHELNTPIGNILTVASTLKDETAVFAQRLTSGQLKRSQAEQATEMMRQASTMIETNAMRSAKLIADFKQVAVDQSSARRRSFDLKSTVDEVLSTLMPMLKRTPHQITLDIPAGLKMDSYPGPIEQIITNLITNSIVHGLEHSAAGEIHICATADDNDTVRIEYRDNGKGMDADTLRHLFDPFYTTKLGQGGSGLGLYIVHNLINGVLGGKITVHSSPGAGAHFCINLPLQAPQKEEQ